MTGYNRSISLPSKEYVTRYDHFKRPGLMKVFVERKGLAHLPAKCLSHLAGNVHSMTAGLMFCVQFLTGRERDFTNEKR